MMAYDPHYHHIVRTWPGPNTGDTITESGNGSTRLYEAQFVTSNCNCDELSGRHIVVSGTATVTTKTPESVGDEARDAEFARKERSSWMSASRVQPPRMRENVRVIQRPEFHARSNPR
jgi:hypothetical protein